MKKFEIPQQYHSSFIGQVKEARRKTDPRKKDFSPTLLDFGKIRFWIARHFGFCYGVANAIEISYKAIAENPNKNIYLLSQMIHNPMVNEDLESRGIKFIMDTKGNQFIPWSEVTADDVVIVPAFGTTLEIEALLQEKQVDIQRYNTTCPFVEKVWKRSAQLGDGGHTIIIHGKAIHEETRATFSHSKEKSPSVVVRDMAQSQLLGKIMLGELPKSDFYTLFEGCYSEGFDPEKDFTKVGVVNQTTMLASETQAIADYFKKVMEQKYGADDLASHFADTRDTLCYATNDNQQATMGLLEEQADLAIVVGGYNSSNTSHIVELCEQKWPTYFIKSAGEIEDRNRIHHFNYPEQKMESTNGWLPEKSPVTVVLTSGASCPDVLLDEVMDLLLSYFPEHKNQKEVLAEVLATA